MVRPAVNNEADAPRPVTEPAHAYLICSVTIGLANSPAQQSEKSTDVTCGTRKQPAQGVDGDHSIPTEN